jgi:hypothetical protein
VVGLSDTVFGATNLNNGNDSDRPINPSCGDIYVALDTHKTYVCYSNGVWSYLSILEDVQYSFEDSVTPAFITCNNTDWSVSFGTPFRTGSQSLRYGKSYTDSGTDINTTGVTIDRVGNIDFYMYMYNDSYKSITQVRIYDGDTLIDTIPTQAQGFMNLNYNININLYIEIDLEWTGLSSGYMGIVIDDLTINEP